MRDRNGGSVIGLGQGAPLRDRFGRVIREGDLVQMAQHKDWDFAVTRIAPSVHPQAPAGALEVTVVTQITFMVEGNKSVQDLTLLLTGPEAQLADAAPQTRDGGLVPPTGDVTDGTPASGPVGIVKPAADDEPKGGE